MLLIALDHSSVPLQAVGQRITWLKPSLPEAAFVRDPGGVRANNMEFSLDIVSLTQAQERPPGPSFFEGAP